MTTIIVWTLVVLILAYVYWQFVRSNMDVPPDAEKHLGALGALRFRLDNDLPIKASDVTQDVHYIQPDKGKPL